MHFQRPGRRTYLNSDHDGDYSYATPQMEDEGISSEAEFGSSGSSPSVDEDDVNERLRPFWPKYQRIFNEHNLHLDTIRDVKGYVPCVQRPFHSYRSEVNNDALCPDPSLVSSFYNRQDIKLKFRLYGSPTVYSEVLDYWTDGDLWQKLSMLVVGSMRLYLSCPVLR